MKNRHALLRHLRDCLLRIREYSTDGYEHFLSDRKTQDAVIRNLEIVGQIVRDIDPAELVKLRPDVPWAKIAGTRNVLAHQYLGVDLRLVWNIIERELASLEQAVDSLIESP